jgi:uncharacterized protein (DUF58 family)
MEVTRRFWAAGALAVLLALGAVVLRRPALLAGTAAIAGWLLARQARFARTAGATADAMTVRQSPARDSVVAEESITVTLQAELETLAESRVTLEAGPPVGTVVEDGSTELRIPPGDQQANATFTLSCPVAGRHAFSPADVTLRDGDGLFRSQFETGEAPTLTVQPRTPGEIHVGQGGEGVTGAFGEHATGEQGPGLVPAQLREYVPGDPADSIDWKATARLQEPHVRQYDVEVDLETALVVDHRATTGEGRPGRTKLDFARSVALTYVAAAAGDSEAIGLYAVGDDGLTVREPPDSGQGQYARLRTRLQDLTATETKSTDRRATTTPGEARRASRRLQDDSAFARRLRPFLADRDPYVTRVDEDPLYRTVRSELRSLGGDVVTVLVTDDSHPAETREAVKLARRGDDHVVVFLLPSVLFEPGGLGDLDDAYERYVEFEEYRRSLAALDRVTAFEVAPGDRIEALLAARGRRADA